MQEILVEVRPRIGTAGDLKPAPPKLESLQDRLGEISATLKMLSMTIGDNLDDLYQAKPDSDYRIEEIELKLNIDLESETGIVIARFKASAGFEASLKWKRK